MLFNPRNLIAWLALLALAGATVLGYLVLARSAGGFYVRQRAEVKSLDPAIITGQLEGRIVDCIFEGLTRWDPQSLERGRASLRVGKFRPTADYTFHVRHNAKWSDGTPFTAADFLFSHRRASIRRPACDYFHIYWTIKNARKLQHAACRCRRSGGNRVKQAGRRDKLRPRRGASRQARPASSRHFPRTWPPKRKTAEAHFTSFEIAGKKRTFQPGDGEMAANSCCWISAKSD